MPLHSDLFPVFHSSCQIPVGRVWLEPLVLLWSIVLT